jgi:hypothetical protein
MKATGIILGFQLLMLILFFGMSRLRSPHVERRFESKRNFSTHPFAGGILSGDGDGGGFHSGK